MKIYMVERGNGLTPPFISEFKGVEIRVTGAIVIENGSKVFKPNAEGRAFFTEKSTALAAMTTHALRKLEQLVKLESRLRLIADRPSEINIYVVPSEKPGPVRL